MKSRDQEAQHLEDDYLKRVQSALGNLPFSEAQEIITDVKQHIDEAASELDGDSISLSQMATILEGLGSPDDYGDKADLSAPRASTNTSIPTNKGFDVGDIFNLMFDVYKINFLPLVAAAVITDVLMICTLLVLAGPLAGGYYVMCYNAIKRDDKRIEFSDLWVGFRQFLPLTGLFFLQFIPLTIGLLVFVVPGLLLMAGWMYTELIMVDRKRGVMDSLGDSWQMAQRHGYGTHVLLSFVALLMLLGPSAIPYLGWVLGFFVTPMAYLIGAAAYHRVCQLEGK